MIQKKATVVHGEYQEEAEDCGPSHVVTQDDRSRESRGEKENPIPMLTRYTESRGIKYGDNMRGIGVRGTRLA